jgi:hypothetical protein
VEIKQQINDLPAGLVRELAELMSGISEAHFGNPWDWDLEYKLWEALNGPAAQAEALYGSSQMKRLRDLFDAAGGWIHLYGLKARQWKSPAFAAGQLIFVPTKEWIEEKGTPTYRLARYDVDKDQ